MSTLKNGEFGIDLDKEKILWTDRKRHTIFSLPLSFTKYTLTETKLIIQRGCFNLREDEIQLYRVRDIAFKQNFYERLCRVGSIHLCSTDAMTPEIDIRRIKNPRDVKEVLSKTIEACRKANGIRTSENPTEPDFRVLRKTKARALFQCRQAGSALLHYSGFILLCCEAGSRSG